MMLINLYNQLFVMSVVVGGLYLVLRLLSVLTMKYFTAFWHYCTYTAIYLFLLLPYHKLIALFHLNFSQKAGNNFTFPTLPFAIAIATSDRNDFVSVEEKTGLELLLDFYFLFYLLIAGTIMFFLVILIQNYKLHCRIFDMCRLTDETQTLEILSKCKQKMRISQNMLVYISPHASTPFLYGILKPRIILPEAEFTMEELECIFYHELTHWKRHDAWLKCLMLLINAVHWYNPLAYIARRDIERHCELSCDESIALTMHHEERRQYCDLLLGVLEHVAMQHAKLYSAFSDKRQLERRINAIMKIGGLKNKKSVRLLAGTLTLIFLLGGAVTAYAASGSPNKSLDEDAVSISMDSVFENVKEVSLVNENVSIINSDVILLEGDSKINIPMASGDLGAGKSYSYDKQYIAKGKKVTINAQWAPTESDLKIGLKSASSGKVAAKTVSGGDGSVTYEIETSGDYYIYIGNPSKSAVKFDVSYIVT